MIGETGLVKETLNPKGIVLVHGELWNAEATTSIAEGKIVRVDLVEGLKIKVTHVENSKTG